MAAVLSIVIVIVLFFTGCEKARDKIKSKLPNFLILVADDAGYRDFGCYGNDNISTPNIDLLASTGIKATNAFLTAPQCSPSRISILTGKYPHATGAEDLHMPLPEGEILLPALLKEKNYYSGLLNKSHLGPNGDNQFNFYSKSLNDFGAFLDSADSKPFFMWVGFTDPHRPYNKNIIDNPQDPNKVYVPPQLVDDQATREDLADYYNEIMRMDKQIGEYLTLLKEQGLLENTLIIFFSDNGAPFPREKGTLYDAGIKTPLTFTWKNKITPDSEYEELISVIDLAPTIIEVAGLEIPDEMQGKSFSKMFADPGFPGRDYIFSERNWHNCDEHMRSVRDERFKLISNAYIDLPHGTASDLASSPSWKSLNALKLIGKLTTAQSRLFEVPRPEFEFYDTINDPYELENLINNEKYLEEIERLKLELERWKQNTSDFPPSERRRKDNTDRFTGVKFDQTRLPGRIN